MTYTAPARCRDCDGTGRAGGNRYAPPPDDPDAQACTSCGGAGSFPRCCYCGTTTRELRPYGIDGLPTCLPCVDGSPERQEIAARAYAAVVAAAEAASPHGIAAITDSGISPLRISPSG